MMVWCMLNPSTADASQDDPTIRRCIAFAVRDGYGGIIVVNLMAYRATRPIDCLIQPDPCGPLNDDFLQRASAREGRVVVAWGARAPRKIVERAMYNFAEARLLCLGITKDGNPRHPLYVSGRQPFEDWSFASLGAGEGGNDICGLCGQPGADKMAHPMHWPGECIPDGPLVHAECEEEECRRAHALLTDEQRQRFLRSI